METTVTLVREADARAVLADPRFAVPALTPEATTGRVGWLRSRVGRFSNGEDHRRRRGYAVTALEHIDPAGLRRRAAQRAAALLDHPPVSTEQLARHVPVAVLAEALGVAETETIGVAEAVATVARGYFPGTDAGAAGEEAVAYLIGVFGGEPDEPTAARIGLLVQACDATAGLILNALRRPDAGRASTEDAIGATLREDPPVRALRRECVAPARLDGAEVTPGTMVVVDVSAANHDSAVGHLTFGGGARPCPAADHALALAAGVIEAVRR